MSTIKVFIADDHSMVRQGIKQLLELNENIEVVGQSGDGELAVNEIIRLNPDIALLDINMPSINGIDATKIIKQKNLKTRIVILTIHNELEYLLKAIDVGADGYILKDSDSDILIEAIKTVHNNKSYIQSSIALQLARKVNGFDYEEDSEHKFSISELTRRELEVLILLTSGMLNKEIAQKLYISEKTVKNHVSNIFKKIGVSDRTQAAIFAIKNSIVDLNKNK
jgi:DNA-binding NarL/FixJ family response regulator